MSARLLCATTRQVPRRQAVATPATPWLGRRTVLGCNSSAPDVTPLMRRWPDDDVILFDGVCVFCSRWVHFVATHDVAKRFRFTAIQSHYGERLAQTFGIDRDNPDTNAVVHGGVAHVKSDAALIVLSHLPGWCWTRILFAAPKTLRDSIYSLVARNRYRIFGKFDACFVPDEDMRARIIE